MTRLWQYVTAVIGYWQFWVAIAFWIERSSERFFPQFAARLNVWLPPERRRRLFIAIAGVAFVYANFRAFDDVSTRLEDARRTNGTEVGQPQVDLLPPAERSLLRWDGELKNNRFSIRLESRPPDVGESGLPTLRLSNSSPVIVQDATVRWRASPLDDLEGLVAASRRLKNYSVTRRGNDVWLALNAGGSGPGDMPIATPLTLASAMSVPLAAGILTPQVSVAATTLFRVVGLA